MDVQESVVNPMVQFYKDSKHLVMKCTKPDRKGAPRGCGVGDRFSGVATLSGQLARCAAEFVRIAAATGVGFLIMGFIGFFVKLIHIPINNIIIGS